MVRLFGGLEVVPWSSLTKVRTGETLLSLSFLEWFAQRLAGKGMWETGPRAPAALCSVRQCLERTCGS